MLNCIQQIWNDKSLYGHCLTSLPGVILKFATSDKLVTYTTPDAGTAKRVWLIFEEYTKTEVLSNGRGKRIQFGTNSLLFKYAEIGIRRVVGTCLTIGAGITAAPLGFAVKI